MDDEDAMAMDTKENSSSHIAEEPSREMGAGGGVDTTMAVAVAAAQSSSSSAGVSADVDMASSSSSAEGMAGGGEGMDSSSSSSSRAMETDDGIAGEAVPGATVFTSTEATAAAANG